MSRYLLDTHVFLWMHASPERLGSARQLIEDEGNELLLSAASSWEIAIKWSIGKLPLPEPPEYFVPSRMSVAATTGLPVTHAHALAVAELPKHHNDPFNRILVAQVAGERLTLLTADEAMRPYGVDVVWVG